MSTSTYFKYKGTEYTSLESMPPDVRAEYEKRLQIQNQLHRGLEQAQRGLEQAQHGADQALSGLSATEPATPAWGGSHSPGAVVVPQAFDPVTSLGPATAVFERDSDLILAFPSFGPPKPNALVLYRDGFAFHKGQELHIWRWDEIVFIQSNVWREGSIGSRYTEHEYTLTQRSGEKVILGNRIKSVGGAAEAIKRQVFAQLLPPLAQTYGAGQALTFGPVTIHKQNGLQLDGKPHAWDAIQDIQVDRGRFKLSLRDGKRHEARASAIPNIELLAQLIGLKFYETGLAYE
jgi:hypothetical protein